MASRYEVHVYNKHAKRWYELHRNARDPTWPTLKQARAICIQTGLTYRIIELRTIRMLVAKIKVEM